MRTTAANCGNLSSQRYWANILCRIWVPSRFRNPNQSLSKACGRFLRLSRFCKTKSSCDLWQTSWSASRIRCCWGRHDRCSGMSIARHWGCSSRSLPLPMESSFLVHIIEVPIQLIDQFLIFPNAFVSLFTVPENKWLFCNQNNRHVLKSFTWTIN